MMGDAGAEAWKTLYDCVSTSLFVWMDVQQHHVKAVGHAFKILRKRTNMYELYCMLMEGYLLQIWSHDELGLNATHSILTKPLERHGTLTCSTRGVAVTAEMQRLEVAPKERRRGLSWRVIGRAVKTVARG
jgi:hypothetical protein